jgi:hypothetical protein
VSLSRNLLCFAKGHAGEWEAFCFDFDIAVQGESFEDVRARLFDAVQLYVLAAHEEDVTTCARLLNRRAPLRVKIAWTLKVLGSAWRNEPPDRDVSASFPVTCAA